MVNYKDENTKFLLWDRQCTELIRQSADEVNSLKIEVESETISSVGYPNCESSHHDSSMDTGGLHIDDSNLMNLVLLEVEKLLQANQRSLKDYSMPYPENANLLTHANNHLILS
ncbi:hypothetical protein JHK84_043263 [Glycine max]|nr:hypothetical protein JHK86_043075 [Glycine max]KAG5117150.1 hypothetical protein JHK84_043263 [Glycine max]